MEGVFDQMHRVDMIGIETSLYPLSLGHRHKSLYFTFHIAEKIHLFQTIPRDLAEIFVHGNAPFAGETARFNAFRPTGHYYREYAAGVSKAFDSYWTAGARVKLLFGKASLNTGQSEIGFTVEENSFDLFLEGDYTLNSSFPITISQDGNGVPNNAVLDDLNYAALLLNRGNPGVAIDLGVIYRYDERTTLSVSLLDVGLLRWKTDLNNIHGTGSFAYTGVDQGIDVISYDFVSDMGDSLLNAFDISLSQVPFNSVLPAQLFLGGSYQVNKLITLGAVSRNVIFRSKIHSSLTLSAQADLADRLLTTLSWSYLNNSIKNLGAGIAYHGKGFQLHVVSDNLLGFFYPFNTRSVNLRAGFNVMFGCPRNRGKEPRGDSYHSQPVVGDCSWAGKPKNRKKQMARTKKRRGKL